MEFWVNPLLAKLSFMGDANPVPGILAVPVSSSSKPSSTQASTNLEKLASDGVFTPVLTRSENIQYGTLAKRVDTKSGPRPMEESYEFRSKEGALAVFLSWQPKEKIKASAMIRIYDLAGRVLIESRPSKLNLKPGKDSAYSWWKADVSALKPAIYRVDVLLDSSPVWRAFFKVRD